METNKLIAWAIGAVCMTGFAGSAAQGQSSSAGQSNGLNPWVGKYPMSLFTKTRSANTVGKGHLSASLKVQHFDWDEIRTTSGDYFSRPSPDTKRKLTSVLCMKYGWAENHHLALGIPYFFNDFDINGSVNDNDGFGNLFLFEKWKAIPETNTRPAVAFDAWVYLPTGDADRKLGNEDWAFKLTTEVSKACEHFSLHFNPGYTWGEDSDVRTGEINLGAIWNLHKNFTPAIEYNYTDKKDIGRCHDLVPGFIWKFAKGWSFKLAAVINVDTTLPEKDAVGVVGKLFYKW